MGVHRVACMEHAMSAHTVHVGGLECLLFASSVHEKRLETVVLTWCAFVPREVAEAAENRS